LDPNNKVNKIFGSEVNKKYLVQTKAENRKPELNS
jgi:hypothetical protein